VGGLAMLPVIPPYGLPIGVALTGAPALAALVLFRKRYPESVFRLVGRRLITAHPVRPPARVSAAPTRRNT
jgi:hypothetical protein